MSSERQFRLAFAAAAGAVIVMVVIAIVLDNPLIAEFSIAAAVMAVLAVRLATRS